MAFPGRAMSLHVNTLLTHLDDCNPRKERSGEKETRHAETKEATLLDSAPSDSSDDSGQVLALPPSRPGGTTFGDFGGRSCCTFRSGLRSSSEHQPGYSLLPHLYQDHANIASRHAQGQIHFACRARGMAQNTSSAWSRRLKFTNFRHFCDIWRSTPDYAFALA
jgi:hypothetical protein